MRYFKFKTGKVIHSDNCEHAKGDREITEAEAREVVFEKGGSYCEATMQARVDEQREELKDCTAPVDPHQPDWDAAIEDVSEALAHDQHAYQEPKPSIREALMDQYHARMERLSKRKAARKALRDHEQARALGLEPGDVVGQPIPNRAQMRFNMTNAKRNGRIKGRPAARRKAPASIWTHRAHTDANRLMIVWQIGTEPSSTARPARKRDRALAKALGAQR